MFTKTIMDKKPFSIKINHIGVQIGWNGMKLVFKKKDTATQQAFWTTNI